MRIKELIKKLEKENPELEIVLQKDDEGNGFEYLRDVDCDVVFHENENEIYNCSWKYHEAEFISKKEWEKFKQDNPKVCVLYP